LSNLTLFIGLPGSGKSTEAKRRVKAEGNTVRVNRDDLRAMCFNSHWTRKREEYIIKTEQNMALQALGLGYNVIVDDTNLNPRTQEAWAELVKKYGDGKVELVKQDFPATPEECHKRDRLRIEGRVGKAVIDNMALRYGRIQWTGKPIVVFDVDGTLADCSLRVQHVQQKPKDWAAFYERVSFDMPHKHIIRWARACAEDYEVVVLSGRPTYHNGKAIGVMTECWLTSYGVPMSHLFMRQDHDTREDWVVKQEIFRYFPEGKVAFVVDDRKQVCDMWRANGVKCFQVADGNF
jgi:predicted kinase